METFPPKLYKFRDWNDDDHKRMITHNEVFFTSCKGFNDPFDCAIRIIYDSFFETDDDQLLSYFRPSFKQERPDLTDEEILRMLRNMLQDPNQHNEMLQIIKETVQKERIENFGIFSTSATCKNILLWSHYAKSHTGFCVEIDTGRFENFMRCKKETWKLIDKTEISYKDKYPILDRLKSSNVQMHIDSLFIKSCNWKYEKEYRFVIWRATNKAFILDDGIISAIYLGCKMKREDKDKIVEELSSKRYKPKLHKAVKCDDRFALKFDPVEY